MAKTLEDAPHQLRAPYTLNDVYFALRLLAFLGGNLKRTHDSLRKDGYGMSMKTIERWSQQQYPEVYSEMQAEIHQEAGLESLYRVIHLTTNATPAEIRRAMEARAKRLEASLRKQRGDNPSLARPRREGPMSHLDHPTRSHARA